MRKTLATMSREERASLLAELFITDIPRFMTDLKESCIVLLNTTEENTEEFRSNKVYAFEDYQVFAAIVADKIGRYREIIQRVPRLFAEELFSEGRSAVTIPYLLKYAENKKCPPAFAAAITLFFQTVELKMVLIINPS